MNDGLTERSEKDGGPDIRSAIVMTLLGLLLGVAPWPSEEVPHLVQKAGFLLDGTLTKPIDIFDLLLHGLPGVVAIYTWFKYLRARLST